MAVNFQTAVEAQLLGINLTGMVARTTNGNQTTTEFLVMPSALDENEPITVGKVVEEINRTIYKIKNNTDEIPEGEVPEIISEDNIIEALKIVGLDDAKLTFMQTFIHYQNVDSGEEANPVVEYAIGIHIKGGTPQSGDFKFLQIKEVYINVWDTTNQKVLERMQIWTPEQLELK